MTDPIRVLRELAKTAEEGYTGLAAYECSSTDTWAATFLAKVARDTADRLEAEAAPDDETGPEGMYVV